MPRLIGIRCGVKVTRQRPAGEVGEALLDLGRVPVGGDAVGVDALGDLGEEAPCLASRPAPLTPDLASMMMPSGSTSPA